MIKRDSQSKLANSESRGLIVLLIVAGHLMPIVGSFHANPLHASGLKGVVIS